LNRDQISNLFQNINVWRKGDQRAPHKPLLLLIALARLNQGLPRLVDYSDVETQLKELLIEFGPSRTSYHPEYPFQRLPSDGIWELKNAENLRPRKSNSDAPKSELIRAKVSGGFTEEVFQSLKDKPGLVSQIAQGLLESSFTDSYHQPILSAIGLDLEQTITSKRKPRDPRFRESVIRAYQRRCAVCSASVQLGGDLLALEAAHIKWHQASGPDVVENGFALCAVHHRLFDRGAFTVSGDGVVLVSEHVNGNQGLVDWLLRYHGAAVAKPVNPRYRPKVEFLRWHLKEVFRGPERPVYLDRVADKV
jgi:putative restriction endonuclease